MGWRDDLAAARGQIHEHFQEAATYTAPTTGAVAVNCQVRVHDQVKSQGDLNGLGYAERIVNAPQIVFLTSAGLALKQDGVVQMADGRRYRIDNVLPSHGITITCDATRLKA